MKSNSNSIGSSSLSNKSPEDFQNRKRIRKRIRKDQDGSHFENLESFHSKSSEQSYHGIEETKTPMTIEQDRYSKKTSFQAVSDFKNGSNHDKNSQNFSSRRKSRREIRSDEEDDHHSDSSPRRKLNKVKVKVKKIDDEGVG